MADNFGLKIGVEGEREFKKALSEINQSFKVLGSEMTLVTSQFDKNDKSIQSVTARNAVLNKEIDAQKEKISTLKAALDNASSSFGENDRRTQNWQIQLNRAQAELNDMERELEESTIEADNLGDELDDSGKSAEDAGGRFEKLGGVLKGIGVAMGAVAVAAGAAAIKLGKEVVQQFGELEQNLVALKLFSVHTLHQFRKPVRKPIETSVSPKVSISPPPTKWVRCSKVLVYSNRKALS